MYVVSVSVNGGLAASFAVTADSVIEDDGGYNAVGSSWTAGAAAFE